jgi:hypothetical protein
MSWERGYYYRAKKVNGRVVKEYVGKGAVGRMAAREDLFAREDRELRRIKERLSREGSADSPAIGR